MSNVWLEPNTWEKLKFSKADAEKHFNQLDIDHLTPVSLKKHEKILRESLIKAIDEAMEPILEIKTPSEYEKDLYTGLAIYKVLNTDFHFNERLASQDDIWRYLSITILPDKVYERYNALNAQRFYKVSRRIWLQTIWWYIHLSWQDSIESTLEILEKNTTDTILQLVDRTGLNGYRIDFTRALMKVFYSEYKDLPGTQRTSLFRRVMKLSTARTKIIEPNLVSGGTEAYVKGLFNYFVETVKV